MENLIVMTNIIFDNSLQNDLIDDGNLRVDTLVNKDPSQIGGGKNRIQYIDLAKGICITLVVLYHVFYNLHYLPPVIKTLSLFRMPLYFFLSGLFFKEYEGFFGFFLRKVNKLLIPFFFFYVVTSFAMPNILLLFGHTVIHKESLGISGIWAFIAKEEFSNSPIWFLWALFLVNIYFYTILVPIKKLTSNKNLIAMSITVIGFSIGFIGTAYLAVPPRINILGFVDSAMSALPFFVMGYLFNRFTEILVPNKWDKYLPIIVMLCFIITFYVGGNCSYKRNIYHITPILQYVCGMTGTLGVIFLAKILRNIPFLTYWGRYSIMILVSHALLLQIYIPIARKLLSDIPQIVMVIVIFIATMFSYQLLIPLMKKYIPYFTAQKNLIDVSKYTK